MADGDHRNWRELCRAALEAKDPDELLRIVQELNKVLKREEQVRRAFREASKPTRLEQSCNADNSILSVRATGSVAQPIHSHCQISKGREYR
jgi:hypothetical protein